MSREKKIKEVEDEAQNELLNINELKNISKQDISKRKKLEKAQITSYIKEAEKFIGIGNLKVEN